MYLKSSLAALLCVSAATIAQAQDVTLKSADGTIELSGELLDFKDGFYVILTELGELRVSTSTVFCEGQLCPATKAPTEYDLNIAGESTLSGTLIPLLVTGYADSLGAEPETQLQDETTIQTITGDQGFGEAIATISTASLSSNTSLASLLDNSADIAMVSRRVSRDEVQSFKQDGAGLLVTPESEMVAALDSLVVVVHPDNPVKSVALTDLAKIYKQEIQNWNQLGGPDLAIRPLGLGAEAASTGTFFDRIGVSEAAANYETLPTETDISILTSEEAGAIGYVGMALQRQNNSLELVDNCGLLHTASTFATKTEEYALTRRIYAYTRADTKSEIRNDFLNFVRSQNADNLIAKAGYVDLGMERISLASIASSQRSYADLSADAYFKKETERYLEAAKGWDRLSITFRFATASSRLDPKAERDLERLLSYVKTLDDGISLAFVGFTDSDGPFGANAALGESRANALLDELSERLSGTGKNVALSTKSFGELAPVACNTNSLGKAMNRRVEVWIQG